MDNTMKVMFIELSAFSREREKYLPNHIFQEFQEYLADNPERGDILVGTGGCRKIRWHRANMGKSSGVRIIYYYLGQKNRIYLLLLYPKNVQENLTDEQRKMLKSVVGCLE